MQCHHPSFPLLSLLLLVACGDKDDSSADTSAPPDSPGDSGPDSPADSGDSEPDTSEPAITACLDGTTGFITQPELAVHVWSDAAPDGDGSWAYPFTSVTEALEATRTLKGDKRIAVWTGDYVENLQLSKDAGDDGTVIQGCSADEVVLSASDPTVPVLLINEAQDVEVSGLCTHGGTRNIQLWGDSSTSLANLLVTGSSEVGVVVHGGATFASLSEVEVVDPQPTKDGFGYGIAIQQGASATIEGGRISGATAAGVLVDDAMDITLDGVTIEGTLADAAGAYGHGVLVEADTLMVAVERSEITDSQGGGVLVLQGLGFTMNDCTVLDTLSATIPDSPDTTGDGVVVSRGEGNGNPASFEASLGGNLIEGSARAGLLLDGVTATVSGNTLSGSGSGDDILAQDGALLSGSDAWVELVEGETLELNQVPLLAVDPGSL